MSERSNRSDRSQKARRAELLTAAASLKAGLTKSEILSALPDTVRPFLDFDYISVFLIDSGRGEGVFVEEPLSSWVIEHQEPAVVPARLRFRAWMIF